MNTKTKILDTSLDLMSERGFDSVSIRDICKVVGIKESTIYYHYKNKKAILGSIVERFEQINQSMTSQFERISFQTIKPDIIKIVTIEYVEQYLLNDFVIKFAKILSIQQHSSIRFKELYLKYFFELPLKFKEQIFKQLIKAKILNDYDAEFVAVSYYSYIFFIYNKYILTQEINESARNEFVDSILSYIEKFIILYAGEAK